MLVLLSLLLALFFAVIPAKAGIALALNLLLLFAVIPAKAGIALALALALFLRPQWAHPAMWQL
ncbi:MAG: hypothetical protein ACN6O2_13645 [Stenotrophomonas sp.]